ncbi:MAG: AIR synthase-related protein, partial [Polyangiaceae bacterium]
VMSTLNRSGCEAMIDVGVHAATDITGFGLLGHLRNIVAASRCTAVVAFDRVPIIAAASEYVAGGIAPGGTHANLRFLADWVDFGALGKPQQLLLCDAQTSGGLLIAVEEKKAERLVRALSERGTLCAAVIGHVEEGPARIRVTAS